MFARSLASTVFVCAELLGGSTAFADEGSGFDNMNSFEYSQLFTDAVQAHQNGRLPESFAIFQRLSCAGDKTAQEQLGLMYLNGEGVPRNTLKAYLWLKVAAEYTFADYRANAKRLESLFSDEQKKATAPLADALRDRYGQRATNITCNSQSHSTFSSTIKDTVVCSPKRNGSMLLIHRCFAEEQAASKPWIGGEGASP